LRTPLFEEHRRLGATLTEFAGWQLPLYYTGIVAEHQAVRRCAGLFDVSHMGELRVSGPQALEAVDRCTANDPGRLRPGRAMYTALCAEDGGTVDDCIVLCRKPASDYLFVVNAANTATDLAWLQEHTAGLKARWQDLSQETALLAVQGPRAAEVVGALLPPPWGARAQSLRAFGVLVDVSWEGGALTVSRTGYTGEDGYELLAPASAAASR